MSGDLDPFEVLYGDAELAGIEARRQPWAVEVAERPPAPAPVARPTAGGASTVRRGVGSVALAVGLVGGLRDVFAPAEDHVVEVEVDRGELFADRPVSFVLVPGDPQASRIVVRPWLSLGPRPGA